MSWTCTSVHKAAFKEPYLCKQVFKEELVVHFKENGSKLWIFLDSVFVDDCVLKCKVSNRLFAENSEYLEARAEATEHVREEIYFVNHRKVLKLQKSWSSLNN